MLPPDFSVLERTPQQARVALVLAEDLPYFRGHFPARTLLPGVAQLDFAIALCDAVFASGTAFTGISRVKFLRPMLPGDALILDLGYQGGAGRLDFVYYIEARQGAATGPPPGIMASRGRLTCTPRPAP